jgi:hypothetical protein
MNKRILAALGIGIVVVTVAAVMASKNPAPTTPASQASPRAASTSADPQDIVPGLYANPITNTATQTGFKIVSITVENNVDPTTGKPVNDNVEIKLQNLTQANLTGFEVYYTVTDSITHQKEGYYKKLSNYTLAPGSTQTVQLDNGTGTGHYGLNTNGIYFKSNNMLTFNVIVSSKGYASVTSQATRSAGGAENKKD